MNKFIKSNKEQIQRNELKKKTFILFCGFFSVPYLFVVVRKDSETVEEGEERSSSLTKMYVI